MDTQNIVIRRETENDRRAVENLVREAFWNIYRPGCLEHYVLHRLRDDAAFVPKLDFVMEKDCVFPLPKKTHMMSRLFSSAMI